MVFKLANGYKKTGIALCIPKANLNLMEACIIQGLNFFQTSQNLMLFQSMTIEEKRKEMLIIIMYFSLLEGTCVQFISSPKTLNIKRFLCFIFPCLYGNY